MPFRTLFVVFLFAAAGAKAQTSYVIDRLLVGVHEEKNLDSAIIKVLPTGTVLKVIERDGELALVEDPDKVRGWVDAAYLTEDTPAVLRVAALEREKLELQTALEQAKTASPAATAAPATGADATEINQLTKENTELKAKLSDERLRAGKLQSEAAALRAQVDSSAAPPDARIIELERERERLASELATTTRENRELSARASLKSTAALVPLVLREYLTAAIILVLLLLAAGFGAGLYVVDVLNRRRHGGFRV